LELHKSTYSPKNHSTSYENQIVISLFLFAKSSFHKNDFKISKSGEYATFSNENGIFMKTTI